MRMNKTTILPFGPFRTKTFAQGFLPPRFIIPKVSDHLVFLIEQGDTGMKVRYKHDISLNIHICGKEETSLGPDMLPIHIKPLESLIGAVADHEFWLTVAGIEPLTVWSLKLSIR